MGDGDTNMFTAGAACRAGAASARTAAHARRAKLVRTFIAFSLRPGGAFSRGYRPGRSNAVPRDAIPCYALPHSASPEVPQHLAGGVVSGHPGHPPSRVGSGAAQVHALHRHAVGRIAKYGPGAEKLVEGELSVKNISTDEAELPLQ